MAANEPSHRLPRSIVPDRYELEIVPDLESSTFTGTVDVSLRAEASTDRIVCNAAGLTIKEASIGEAGGTRVPATAVEVDEASEQVTFVLADPLPVGRAAVLHLSFAGALDDGLRGFYRSRFTDADGVTHTIGTTQFESTDARRAFPCWDEPEWKAVFGVSLVVPAALTALSSGIQIEREDLGGDLVRVRFADTIPMSTYILAWVIGPFEVTGTVDAGGVPLRIAAPRGREPLTRFGLESGAHALQFLAAYFGLPYPGDKLDHVAIPDFAFGAMENFGCVTYRETALLADEATASQPELMRVAEVVAHETAHMWFGNLVTMRWWNGIWLNEAFATFMELKTVDDFRPEWMAWTSHSAAKAEALTIDGLATTRPIEFEVNAPEDADAMFDVLTYEKGGSVLRMLEHYLGEEVFRRGISRYLSEHRFANTETTDLWDALEAESGEPVRAVMDSWIFQAGYPVVRIERGADAATVRLSQRQFRYLGEGDGHWSVPVSLRASVGGNQVSRRLLLDAPTDVTFDGPVDWVIGNEAGTGFYRTEYEPALRPRSVAGDAGHPLERFHLLTDTWAAVTVGTAGLADFVDLVRGMSAERDPDVWRAVAGPLAVLDRVAGDDARAGLERLVADVAGPGFAELGWDPTPGEAARLGVTRARLITLLGTVGADAGVRETAARRHRALVDTGSGLTPDVVAAAVAVIAATGGADAYAGLLGCYREAATPQDRIRYMVALAGFEDPALVARSADLAISEEVRPQDGPIMLGRLLGGPAGAEVVWPWIEDHLDALTERFTRSLLLRVFEGLTSVTDPGTAERAHRFLSEHRLPVGAQRVAQIEEQLDISVALATRLAPTLAGDLGG